MKCLPASCLAAICCLSVNTATANDLFTQYLWDGTCTQSQVDGKGQLSITRIARGAEYVVQLKGDFTINSPTYGYIRHQLPQGLRPSLNAGETISCDLQRHETSGDTSAINNYGGQGVHVRADDFAGFTDSATLWFPENLCSSSFTHLNWAISHWNSRSAIR